MTGILTGVKVVEFSQNAAVPHCGRLLAGMGAEVVKVEPPGGDAMRGGIKIAPPNEAKAFAVINPGKRGIVLDLASEGAREVIDRLFGWADVALVGFKLGDLARYGIDWEHARTINPRLVHLTHTPFGPNGPHAEVGGYDVLAQGWSGAGYYMNRAEHGEPVSTRPAVFDFSTGMLGALGVVAALRHRDLTGEGQRVDVALLASAMSIGTPVVHRFEFDDELIDDVEGELDDLRAAGAGFGEQREMYERRVITGAGAFRLYFRHYLTADGIVSVAGMSRSLVDKFHDVTGLPRPNLHDPHSPEFDAVVEAAEALFRGRTTEEWIEALRAVGYPCGPYHLPHEAVDDEQVRANDFTVDIEHPAFGRYTTSGTPVQFSATPNVPLGPSPMFGQHTADVMSELGFTDDETTALFDDGTIT